MNLSLDFAFEGFRLIRQRPYLVPFWGIVSLIGNGAAAAGFLSVAGPALQQLSQLAPNADPMATLALLGKIMPGYAVMLPLSVITQSILSCAIFRAVIDGKALSFGGLRFGGDELRQIVLGFLFLIVFFCLEIVCLIAGSIVGLVIASVLAAVSQAASSVGMMLGILAGVAALMWVFMRLSLYAPQSYDQKRINLFGSWTLTKAHGRGLAIGYMAALVTGVMVYFLCLGIFWAIVTAINKGDLSTMMESMTSGRISGIGSLSDFYDPVKVGYTVVVHMLLTPLLVAITAGAPAAAYKALTGAGKAQTAESVF